MATDTSFRDVVAERSRRIAREARTRAQAAGERFSGPRAEAAATWLGRLLGRLPEGVRQALREALGPDEAVERAHDLMAAALREKADLRLRESALDAARSDLDRAHAALREARAELLAREASTERLLAQARRAAQEAAVERRVPLAAVRFDPADSPRPLRGVARLAANIKRFGQLTPIVVRPEGDGYRLVTGYRRMAALQKAACPIVHIRVVENLDDTTAAALYVAENCLVDGMSSKAVAKLAREIGDKPGFADVLPRVLADDEAAVEEVFLDEMVEEARHHLAEGAAWVAAMRPYWSDIEGEERRPLEQLIVYFAKVARRLSL